MKERTESKFGPAWEDLVKDAVDTAVQMGHEKDSIHTSKTKTSFSIPTLTHVLIKMLSNKTGASQGEIIQLAPVFFKALVDKSLKRRKNALSMLRTLEGQVKSSLEAMKVVAPHLGMQLSSLECDLDDLVSSEEASVDSNNYTGLEVLYGRWDGMEQRETPAYYEDLLELLGQNEQAIAQARFLGMEGEPSEEL